MPCLKVIFLVFLVLCFVSLILFTSTVTDDAFMRLFPFRIIFGVPSSQCHIFVSRVSFRSKLKRVDLLICFFTVFKGIEHYRFRIIAFSAVISNFVFEPHKVL